MTIEDYSWVARDVTKNQTTEETIDSSEFLLPPGITVPKHLYIKKNFWLERVLRFAREDA